eukprot:TRINITY_DN56514_c0_g1_i3.p1 TRINITY_DN56514_c0_g1~~TRINITY_DN56514_c0_g1_i3.p1  ORF type:complete len:123 (-),score=23.10 TRINITY_DN56514_c0_g1_i3:26-394(-)
MAELAVLLLCNGMSGTELSESLSELKSASKNCGTHKQREFWWEAYGKIVAHANSQDGELYGFVTFRTPAGAPGEGVDPRDGLSLIHISEPTRLLSISYAVFCLKKKKINSTLILSALYEYKI